AKAESTTFEPEAEALTAKAQVLMARHAINDAVLRGAGGGGQPVTRRLPVDDPYADPKSSLLSAIARANGARTVWYPQYALMAVIGYPGDLDGIEALFTSLLVQAGRTLVAKGPVVDEFGRSQTRSFRQSFLASYANRIGERLEEAAAEARREAEEEMSANLLPVLASRDREVDEAVAKAFPHLRRHRPHMATNSAGWRAGRIAAETATLGPDQARLGNRSSAS
ncbi:MAG: DUF2786 domain-containing protein, partial [Acidimicrobiales bacterium]